MSKIRKLYYFDKKNAQEMISFLNNSINDTYINKIMFNPFMFLHHFLPLKIKFLPESFVLKDGKELKGLITVAPIKCRHRKVEIQKLFFEENSFYDAAELVQFAVSKYKAMGASSIIVKVDDYLPELITMLVSKCGFSQISYEKLWRINKSCKKDFDNNSYRIFRNSDSKTIANIYNDALLPHFRLFLSKESKEFKENLFKGLSYYSEYKYVIEDKKTKKTLGCIIIKTSDNENYVADITQVSWINLDLDEILSFISQQIKKRKKRFGLFVQTNRYNNLGEKLETEFLKQGYDCVQNKIVLTNSSARLLKEDCKTGKFTVLANFIPSRIVSST